MTLGVAPYYNISCYIMLRHEVLPHVTTLGVAQVDPMLRHEMLPHVTTLGVAQVVERACVRARQRADGVRTYVRTCMYVRIMIMARTYVRTYIPLLGLQTSV